MTAESFARSLHARRIGKGKWVAKCPAHPDRNPSLSIAEGRKVPVVLKCMSNGCSTKEVLDAVGMKWGDLMGESAITPEIRGRLGDENYLAKLQRKLGLAIMLGVLEPEMRNYWGAAVNGIEKDIRTLRHKLYPRERAEFELQAKIKKEGWDKLWETVA